MVGNRPIGGEYDYGSDTIRPQQRAERSPAGQAAGPANRGRFRNRFPSREELAALLVGGILRLPRNYRRGMFLDVIT
jgi:hypothetical protein